MTMTEAAIDTLDDEALFSVWRNAAMAAKEAVEYERMCREALAGRFPDPVVGTNHHPTLPLKLIEKESFTIDQKTIQQTLSVLQKTGQLTAPPVKWQAELVKSAYDAMSDTQRAILATSLTIKRAMPTLQLKA